MFPSSKGLAVRPKPQFTQIRLDFTVEPPRFLLLLAPLGGEAGHLVGERLAVVLLRGCADVAAGRQDVPCCLISSGVALLQNPGMSA